MLGERDIFVGRFFVDWVNDTVHVRLIDDIDPATGVLEGAARQRGWFTRSGAGNIFLQGLRLRNFATFPQPSQAAVQTARARRDQAAYNVELTVIRAPQDGRIVRRYANPGSGASTLQVTPLFQLQPDTQRIVRAELEERSLSLVSAGQKVEIVPESDQTATYPGSVIRIAEVMGSRKLKSDDPSERTDERVVEVVIDAESAPVLVGQRVFVKFLKGDGKTAQR